MRIQTKSDKADVVNCMCKLALVTDPLPPVVGR